jgi:hypothetical protein
MHSRSDRDHKTVDLWITARVEYVKYTLQGDIRTKKKLEAIRMTASP